MSLNKTLVKKIEKTGKVIKEKSKKVKEPVTQSDYLFDEGQSSYSSPFVMNKDIGDKYPSVTMGDNILVPLAKYTISENKLAASQLYCYSIPLPDGSVVEVSHKEPRKYPADTNTLFPVDYYGTNKLYEGCIGEVLVDTEFFLYDLTAYRKGHLLLCVNSSLSDQRNAVQYSRNKEQGLTIVRNGKLIDSQIYGDNLLIGVKAVSTFNKCSFIDSTVVTALDTKMEFDINGSIKKILVNSYYYGESPQINNVMYTDSTCINATIPSNISIQGSYVVNSTVSRHTSGHITDTYMVCSSVGSKSYMSISDSYLQRVTIDVNRLFCTNTKLNTREVICDNSMNVYLMNSCSTRVLTHILLSSFVRFTFGGIGGDSYLSFGKHDLGIAIPNHSTVDEIVNLLQQSNKSKLLPHELSIVADMFVDCVATNVIVNKLLRNSKINTYDEHDNVPF